MNLRRINDPYAQQGSHQTIHGKKPEKTVKASLQLTPHFPWMVSLDFSARASIDAPAAKVIPQTPLAKMKSFTCVPMAPKRGDACPSESLIAIPVTARSV